MTAAFRGMGYSGWCAPRAAKWHEQCSSGSCVCWCHSTAAGVVTITQPVRLCITHWATAVYETDDFCHKPDWDGSTCRMVWFETRPFAEVRT